MTTDQVVAYAAIAVAVGSELLALNPKLRANSWTQLALQVLRSVASSRRN
jgi:hypothetical protein